MSLEHAGELTRMSKSASRYVCVQLYAQVALTLLNAPKLYSVAEPANPGCDYPARRKIARDIKPVDWSSDIVNEASLTKSYARCQDAITQRASAGYAESFFPKNGQMYQR